MTPPRTPRLVFGQEPPPEPVKPVSMAYVGRASCGHVRVIQLDRRSESLSDFIAAGVGGLTLERVPTADAQRDFGECSRCRSPKQEEMAL